MACTTHTNSDNMGTVMVSKTIEIIVELFESLLQRYQERLEESMKGNQFIFDSVNVLYYNLNKISLNRCGSNIDCLKWLKNKNATINLKINNAKLFQYALTAALNYQNIKNNPERLTNIWIFINQYNWK